MKHAYYRIGPHLVSIFRRDKNFSAEVVEALMPSLKPFRLATCPKGERPLFMLHLTDKYHINSARTMESGRFEWDEAQIVVNQVVLPIALALALPTALPARGGALPARGGALPARGSFHADGEEDMGEDMGENVEENVEYKKYKVYDLALTLRGRENEVHHMAVDFHAGRATIELSPNLQGATDSFLLTNCLMMAYSFFAIRKHTVLMHASAVTLKGKGYLFLGKSGTGKSTHSRFWISTLPGAELLNDDNPIVHFDSTTERATVYGSPWSGKTPCYRAVNVPLGAFVRLTQAPVNRIYRATNAQAMALLLPSCSSFRQDATVYNHLLCTVTRMAERLPIFQLECLPNEAAATLCYMTVKKPR